MLWSRAAASNTPLWSLIPAKKGGLSWLGEVNRLVCVTLSQATTPLPGVVAYILPLPLRLLGNSAQCSASPCWAPWWVGA